MLPETSRLDALRDCFQRAMKTSALASSLTALGRIATRMAEGRALSAKERAALIAQGNTCADWSQVRVAGEGALPPISGSHFAGRISLKAASGALIDGRGLAWPVGIRNSWIEDSVIGAAAIDSVGRMDHCLIGDGAIVAQTQSLSCGSGQRFSLGHCIHPGDETGSRCLWFWDGIYLQEGEWALSLSPADQKLFQDHVAREIGSLGSDYAFVGPGAKVIGNGRIEDSWIGEGAEVCGASLISRCALMSQADAPCRIGTGARLVQSFLQAGAAVQEAGSISHTLMLEFSAVEESGMVSQSVIGPNTHIAKGEVTACFLGPFVGFHHQSLLIAALWPEGRGNIAYGAKVGSNHTGKKPDQEIRPGEGVFFGLGCAVKFPARFDDAPYSLLASGLITQPQRVSYPFSLLVQPTVAATGGLTGLNEIRPGYLWAENLYALVRNSFKYLQRDKSRHHLLNPFILPHGLIRDGFFAGRLFSPDIIAKVAEAYERLKPMQTAVGRIKTGEGKGCFLPQDIPGLGQNFLRQDQLSKSLAAYEQFLRLALLRWGAEPEMAADSQARALCCEPALRALGLPFDSPWRQALDPWRPILQDLPARLKRELDKETLRGEAILDDYSILHGKTDQDAVIAQLTLAVQDLEKALDNLA